MKSRVHPYIGRDGDTPCIGHVCPYDTSCNLNLGIDPIKQNTFSLSGEVLLKLAYNFYDYFATRGKIKRAERGDSFPHRILFWNNKYIYDEIQSNIVRYPFISLFVWQRMIFTKQKR